MQRRRLCKDTEASDKIIVFVLVGLVALSLLSVTAYFLLDSNGEDVNVNEMTWIDPVIEIEDENHSHSDLLAHRLSTDNIQLIDYHNLNCDGNEKPPTELDNTAGRPCYPEFKNAAPTPGDSSEIAIEGNFLE